MSITPQHTQELLQRAYVLAVAADAGLNVAIGKQFDYGVDAEVGRVSRMKDVRGEMHFLDDPYLLRMQLKATTAWSDDGSVIRYRCSARTYNRIVMHNNHERTPMILVVFCQPKERRDWLAVTNSALTMRTACYWCFLNGRQIEGRSVVVQIPRSQILGPAELNGIMDRIEKGARP